MLTTTSGGGGRNQLSSDDVCIDVRAWSKINRRSILIIQTDDQFYSVDGIAMVIVMTVARLAVPTR